METPNGKIGHAEIRIGDSIIMLADEMPDTDQFRRDAESGGQLDVN